MNKSFFVCLLLLVGISCTKKESTTQELSKQDSIYQMMVYKNSTQLEDNGWKLKSSIPINDTCSVMKFLYRDEVGFSLDSVFCMAVFENIKGTEYKLVAPWLGAGMVVQKSNLLMEKSLVVSKEEMK